MDEKPANSGEDLLFGDRKFQGQEAEKLFESIVAELERQIAFLKTKFKTEEAFNEFLSMLSGKNKPVL